MRKSIEAVAANLDAELARIAEIEKSTEPPIRLRRPRLFPRPELFDESFTPGPAGGRLPEIHAR